MRIDVPALNTRVTWVFERFLRLSPPETVPAMVDDWKEIENNENLGEKGYAKGMQKSQLDD